MDGLISCRCKKLPNAVLGKTTKLPSKFIEVIGSKSHFFYPSDPKAPILSPKAFIALVRCKACGQHWQADAMQGYLIKQANFPMLCIKIPDEQVPTWKSFDDMPARASFFPEMKRGISQATCLTEKCGNMAIKGFALCATCICKMRSKGKEPEQLPNPSFKGTPDGAP
jgi:hypothetical protein